MSNKPFSGKIRFLDHFLLFTIFTIEIFTILLFLNYQIYKYLLSVYFGFFFLNLYRDQLTRHQYYLQLRRDILEEKTRCNEQAALQLASLALQAEMGDYHFETMGRNYFLPEHYIPTEVIDMLGVPRIRQKLPPMHATHSGMAELQAEMEYLMVRWKKNCIFLKLIKKGQCPQIHWRGTKSMK